jgi:hypothetical protein
MIIHSREHRKFIPPCFLWTKNKCISTTFFMNNRSVLQESWQSPRRCTKMWLIFVITIYLSHPQNKRVYLIWFLWFGVPCRTRVRSGRLDPYRRGWAGGAALFIGEWGAQLRSCGRQWWMAPSASATLCTLLLEPPRRLLQDLRGCVQPCHDLAEDTCMASVACLLLGGFAIGR